MLTILVAVAAFVAGVLVGRANPKKVEKAVAGAKDVAEKVEQQIDELQK